MTPKEPTSHPLIERSKAIVNILSENSGKLITALDLACIIFKKECKQKGYEYNIVNEDLRHLVKLGLLNTRSERLGEFGRKRFVYSVNEKTANFVSVLTDFKQKQSTLRAKLRPTLTEEQEVAIYRNLIKSVREIFEKNPKRKLSASDVAKLIYGKDYTRLQFLRCRGALGALCDTNFLFFDLSSGIYRVKSEKDTVKFAEYGRKRKIGTQVSADRKRKIRKTA